VKTRATFERGIGSARGGAEAAGWDTGRLGTWVFAHRRALQVASLVVGGLVLVFWNQPTAWVVVWVALAVVLALAVVEFLGTPSAEPAPSAEGSAPAVPRQVPRTPEEQTDAVVAPTVTGADSGAKP
jgi:hypothetical protein